MDSASSARVRRRALLACSDASTRERIVTALAGSAVELVTADDLEIAVATLGRQSFPLVLVDRMLGSVDGLELVRRVRAFSVEAVYVAMLTPSTNGAELEHGYCEGVDQYIPRDVAVPALLERVRAAFKAIALRRASRRSPLRNEDVITVDLSSGAHTARHLVGRLNAEIKLAHHTSRSLDIVIVRVHSPKDGSNNGEEQLAAALQAVQTAIRPQADWVACLHPVGRSQRIAVVLPDPQPTSVEALEQHVRNAFVLGASSANSAPELSFGHVTFAAGANNELPTALGLLAQAERHLRQHMPPSKTKAGITQATGENSMSA